MIDEFMWKWQHYFRIGVQTRVESALREIGARLDPRVTLVGLAEAADARHPICIEPESGPLRPEHLSELFERADAIYQVDPDRKIVNSDSSVHEARQRYLQKQARGLAIAEAIDSSGTAVGRFLAASPGGRIGDFEVHVIISIHQGQFEALTKLPPDDKSRYLATPTSLAEAVISLMLEEADFALRLTEPGTGAIRRSTQDIVREAADRLCNGCFIRAGDIPLVSTFDAFSAVSERMYERVAASGRILIVPPASPEVEVISKFAAPVQLSATRAVRKLLETSDRDHALLVHKEGAYGIGRFTSADNGGDAFEVRITEHATWELSYRGKPILRVAYGRAALPAPTFEGRLVIDSLDRIFGGEANIDTLIELIDVATHASHGTTLVISRTAESEAHRLENPAILVEPSLLSPELLTQYARMDGALLLSPDGVCHAVGVILDGHAVDRGDASRGARYNSAVRYQAAADPATLLVVVSEDGGADLVPTPRLRARRSAVEDAVTLLEEALSATSGGAFNDALRVVNRYRFYFSEDQCEALNAACEADEGHQAAAAGLIIQRPRFQPDPDMNDSFFIDERP